MKIGLFGISGVYNYGCEAIVRGSYTYFKTCFPDAHIIYYSFCPDYDRDRLSDMDIEIVPIGFHTPLYKRVVNKLLRLCHSKKQLLMLNDKTKLEALDMMVSIGGDLYTIPKIERSKKKYSYHNVLVDICYFVRRKKTKFIIFGASIGPFGSYKHAVNYYRSSLNLVDCIICREKASIEYLNNLGVKKTMFLPDPAFLVTDGMNGNYNPNGFIGINLSYLSLFENLASDERENKLFELKQFIETLYRQLNKDIMLIPHVVYGDNEKDNDFIFLSRVFELLDEKIKEHVMFANYSGGFLGIKKELRKCSLVISARMHCCVNAIRECVPTIFIAYSTKSEGMCQFVYGSKECVINIETLDKQSIEIIENAYAKKEQLHSFLVDRNEQILNMFVNTLDAGVVSIYDET